MQVMHIHLVKLVPTLDIDFVAGFLLLSPVFQSGWFDLRTRPLVDEIMVKALSSEWHW